MKYYLFIDESGDHNLGNFNPIFPVFTLCGIIISEANYKIFDQRLNAIKERFWKNKNIVFHSRDIRRLQKGFEILFDIDVRKQFYEQLNALIKETPFTVVAANILKVPFIKKHGRLEDVYGTSLSFLIERTIFFLDDERKQIPNLNLHAFVEKRGTDADADLLHFYNKLYGRGTFYVKPERIQETLHGFHFRWKRENINGLQLADLVAYPIANYVLNPKTVNLSYEIIEPKIYQKNGKRFGIKIYPDE